MGFRNAHWDTEGCTCLERNKKMQVRWPWHSGMLTGTWMDAPGWKEIKKVQVHRQWDSGMFTRTRMDAPGWKEIKQRRSVSNGIRECLLGYGWMHLSGKK